MRILQEDAAAVIVDVQERLFPHIHEKEYLERSLAILIRGLKALDVPLIVTQQYTKGLGPTISSIAEVLETDAYIEKIAFSCCGEPRFMKAVEELGRKRIILAGIESHVCVLQTGIDLLGAGHTVVVPVNCVSSRKQEDKAAALERFRSEGAYLATYESVLFELCREAGTSTFKTISNLVK